MATVYRIHPAIGIARLGNSPNEFFVGPERPGERPAPPGGFKDAQCRVKRQAARFRIYAHHDDLSVEEITDAEAEITWTVHLANKKASYPGRGNSEPAADLNIDPGPRTLEGPNQIERFDTGSIHFSGQPVTTVELGEIRSDDDNRLLVLGGFGRSASPGGNGIGSFWGNAGWYDDISDGPVTATLRVRATGTIHPVEGAWVIVAPPKFAPHQDSVVTLWDRVFQTMVDAGHATAPTTTSYTQDVYPVLQRARDTRWVYETYAHNWADPIVAQPMREFIFNKLRPLGNMPALLGSDSALTAVQYAHMQRWKDNNFTNDWVGVPPPQADVTPQGLDRAALEACVGGAFYPGIEAGGLDDSQRPITTASNYDGFLRFDPAAVGPGSISASMALPWQADFNACADNWWPVPRPNQVTPQGASGYEEWDRGVGSYEDMVAKWHTLGFVVRQGAVHVEVDRCENASITLLTPQLDFVDIPQGPMGMVREQPLAISFEVIAPGGPLTLEYAPGGAPMHAQLVAANASVSAGPTSPGAVQTVRLWVIYRTGSAGSALPTQVVTVQEPVSGQQWAITIDGNTVARRTAAAALVLDRSGSMSEDRGDGLSKHVSLQQAASIFVDVMLEGDGVGLVRYNDDAQALQPVLQLGAGGLSDLNRSATLDLIHGSGLDPAGNTSIGDGIHEGRQILNAAAGSYDLKSLVVLTDGKENRTRYIADVASDINERTYAVGFGTPQNTSAAALQTVSGNHGGFLLVTGAIGTDNRFLLQKYFLQILAGVSNAEVVLDPDGELAPGAVHRTSLPAQRGGCRCRRDPADALPPGGGLPAADPQRAAAGALAGAERAGHAVCLGPRRQLLPAGAAGPAGRGALRPARHLACAAEPRPAARPAHRRQPGRRRPQHPARPARRPGRCPRTPAACGAQRVAARLRGGAGGGHGRREPLHGRSRCCGPGPEPAPPALQPGGAQPLQPVAAGRAAAERLRAGGPGAALGQPDAVGPAAVARCRGLGRVDATRRQPHHRELQRRRRGPLASAVHRGVARALPPAGACQRAHPQGPALPARATVDRGGLARR
ncbi:LodA/GoxA family CTQ-dependent oxidase [Aquabacterium sp. A7-Y]|uniref:LodA/GoxA family CTQ-dependent oxidase n=1 Tax=Aquabacterium sp. A7-Y TaxID=1349605 RepID=UPI00223DAB32|nr:LodA/GoxA family CTQ-dependent oxidase [Aquabacterium sp. A7-Y]MCW7541726.1 LodA/GoxA family CTQ-dependent oxidase [Aquabacterium sp. A7-Y]